MIIIIIIKLLIYFPVEIKGDSRNIISNLIIFLHKSRIQRTYSSWPGDIQDCQAAAARCMAAALIMGLGFGDIRVFECLAYFLAAAVIILAARLRMLADLAGRCC